MEVDTGAWSEWKAWASDEGLKQAVVNPLGLSAPAMVTVVVGKTLGGLLADGLLLLVCMLLGAKKLPTRDPTPISKGLETLIAKDYLFLAINQVLEAIGVMHVVQVVLSEPKVQWGLEDLTVANSLLVVYTIVMVDDFMYYFIHRLMHVPALYPYCHKHHHRQSMPKRGYLDAANEHPMEQVFGLGLMIIAVHLVVTYWPLGVHVAGVLGFLLVYAATAFLNHTPYDIKLGWLMLGYSVRAHEMHHRFPQTNYAQNTMVWDKLFGTFEEYRCSRPATLSTKKLS
mmetsp:Transcript_5828/g.10428  ORF Transcript_5828/g.10428 Transcript_5828/m.10428 type:complete len:284 (+) Transcript_5828:99-950(+)